MKFAVKLLPWFFVGLFGLEILAVFMPKKDGEYHVREFGRLPVLMNGRVQPFDTVGHNTLLQLRSTADVPLEEVPSWKFWHHPKKLRSSEWLLEVLFKPEVADTRPVFLIHHPELLAELNLQDKGVEKSGLRYYTFEQLKPMLNLVQQQASKAPAEDKLRTPLQRQVMKLYNALFLYQTMKGAARPTMWDDFQKELAAFEKNMEPGLAAMRARDEGKEHDKNALAALLAPVTEFYSQARDGNAGQRYPLVVPPYTREQRRDDWNSMGQVLLESVRNRAIPAPVKMIAAMSTGYASGNANQFNAALGEYKNWLKTEGFTKEIKKGRDEFFFNDTKAFLHAVIIYIAAFVLAAGALLTLAAMPGLSESLRRSAFYLVILAGVLHTFGLIFRMYLEGRPPVTNLYSSAIFIGWGALILGIVVERIYRVGLGNLVASVTGFVTLIIGHNLALGGDTMEMMRAVLDTNFWLATHVVTVTLGYSATFVAGLLGIIYIFLGLLTPLLSQKLTKSGAAALIVDGGEKTAANLAPQAGKTDFGRAIAKMVYGVICFATLFSFAGTVLGGIWADQSWGRFWGWDPKENGALIIVLWNAVILHARWGGLVKDRGLMNMAVFGNIVTAFSWFGVNMLGVGLHSYGFMDSGRFWLTNFVVSQIVIIGFGLLPLRIWRSFRGPAKPVAPMGGDSAAAPA